MRAPTRGLLGTGEFRGEPRERDVRWNGHAVRVTTPVPTDVWTTVASTDPSTLPFHTGLAGLRLLGQRVAGRERLYELPGGRQLVLIMARRGSPSRLAVKASWPPGWGSGGVLAPGGVRPEEVALVSATWPGAGPSARPCAPDSLQLLRGRR